MKYVTESIANALFEARKSREVNESFINYKKMANDILSEWDKLVKKGGSNNMKKAVKTYIKKNPIDLEDFDYNDFDKEAQRIWDIGNLKGDSHYKKGSLPWYNADAQMGLGNSNEVGDGDWQDWFDEY